jgi:hypothetical protein
MECSLLRIPAAGNNFASRLGRGKDGAGYRGRFTTARFPRHATRHDFKPLSSLPGICLSSRLVQFGLQEYRGIGASKQGFGRDLFGRPLACRCSTDACRCLVELPLRLRLHSGGNRRAASRTARRLEIKCADQFSNEHLAHQRPKGLPREADPAHQLSKTQGGVEADRLRFMNSRVFAYIRG